MGIVEIIPGVSGGTMALVLGIYGKMIKGINATFGWAGHWLRRLFLGKNAGVNHDFSPPFAFLTLVVTGMVASLLAGSHLITKLLSTAPGPTYAFFFGLVLASVATPWRLMERHGPAEVTVILLASAVSFLANGLRTAEVLAPTLPFLLVSGVVAVAVLMLPGVSGSFVLLALGSYGYLIERVRGLTAGEISESVLPLAVFGIGVILGLATATRFISWLLTRHRSLTLAALSGLMLGSLRALMPFYQDGQTVPLREVLTQEVEITPIAIAAVAGVGVVVVLSRVARRGMTGVARLR